MVEPTASHEFGPEEVGLALRNHGMLLEGLRYDVTPVGMHYLLIHFDVCRSWTRRPAPSPWADEYATRCA